VLRNLLASVWTFLRESMIENLGLKALALAFALGLFAFVHGQAGAHAAQRVDRRHPGYSDLKKSRCRALSPSWARALSQLYWFVRSRTPMTIRMIPLITVSAT